MDRLRRRLTKKRRSSCGGSIVKAVADDTTSSSTQHCSPEIVSVSVTSAAMSVNYGQRDFNSSTTHIVTANSKALGTASEVVTPTTAATTPTAASSADAKRLLKQQYDIVRSNLISTPSDEDLKAPLASQKETDVSSLPSNTHSAVNFFEPSFAEFEIVQSPKIPSPFKLSTPEYRKGGKSLSKRSISVLSEINISTMDDVSEIGTPEGLNNKDENLVCLQVLNETLTRGGGHCVSNHNVDNDIVSLPQLSVVTPEDDQQCRRKTMNDSPYQTTTKSSSYNYCTDEDVQKLCNDMIQALSNNMKGCGLNDTYDSTILDDIKNSLWSE